MPRYKLLSQGGKTHYLRTKYGYELVFVDPAIYLYRCIFGKCKSEEESEKKKPVVTLQYLNALQKECKQIALSDHFNSSEFMQDVFHLIEEPNVEKQNEKWCSETSASRAIRKYNNVNIQFTEEERIFMKYLACKHEYLGGY